MARTGVIRALAVTAVFLAAGLGLPSNAPAQTAAERQAVGILFLLGSSRSGTLASDKIAGQKPKPGIAASQQAQGRVVDEKQKPVSASRKLDQSVRLRDSPHV